jgi:ergothioneine biosynthesis protein EgtB
MPTAQLAPQIINRAGIVGWFLRSRARGRALFDLLTPDAYYARPIPLRHPVVFYEGHLAAFNLNTLVKKALGRPGIDERLERLFARGIDPGDVESATRSGPEGWPTREAVLSFVREADELVLDALEHAELDRPGHPLLDRGQAVYAILEHEAMHHETMLYMWHRLPYEQKRAQAAGAPEPAGRAPEPETVRIPAGRATLGAREDDVAFGWDNEFEAISVHVPSFTIDRYNITNDQFREFVDAGGYEDSRWWTPDALAWLRDEAVSFPGFWVPRDGEFRWRGMFEEMAWPGSWPVYVSQVEAAAYARWRGQRLPTEAEFHRAAFGTPAGDERQHPWGEQPPASSLGNFDFSRWDPAPVGSHPAGASAWGVEDLVGNGWEWTSTVFGPFRGFRPTQSYPEYSADFFDGHHFVMKGASPATARELLRPSFRNWFRPEYPYIYATFRCAFDRPERG